MSTVTRACTIARCFVSVFASGEITSQPSEKALGPNPPLFEFRPQNRQKGHAIWKYAISNLWMKHVLNNMKYRRRFCFLLIGSFLTISLCFSFVAETKCLSISKRSMGRISSSIREMVDQGAGQYDWRHHILLEILWDEGEHPFQSFHNSVLTIPPLIWQGLLVVINTIIRESITSSRRVSGAFSRSNQWVIEEVSRVVLEMVGRKTWFLIRFSISNY